MKDILYSDKIRDPQSKAVNASDNWLVCKKINKRWHIIQSDWSARKAMEAKNIMANHDLINGHITDIHTYQVFKKDECEIRRTL